MIKSTTLQTAYLAANANFEAQIKQAGIKPKAREDMLAGFSNGWRFALAVLKQEGAIEIDDSK